MHSGYCPSYAGNGCKVHQLAILPQLGIQQQLALSNFSTVNQDHHNVIVDSYEEQKRKVLEHQTKVSDTMNIMLAKFDIKLKAITQHQHQSSQNRPRIRTSRKRTESEQTRRHLSDGKIGTGEVFDVRDDSNIVYGHAPPRRINSSETNQVSILKDSYNMIQFNLNLFMKSN